jgi:hypothetical protein
MVHQKGRRPAAAPEEQASGRAAPVAAQYSDAGRKRKPLRQTAKNWCFVGYTGLEDQIVAPLPGFTACARRHEN